MSSHRLETKLQLFLSCSNLPNKDLISKSDPQVMVYMKGQPKPGMRKSALPWIEVGRTEIIKDTLNPRFSTPINVSYFFEETQPIKFIVYDIDKEGGKLEDQDFLGEIETTLATIGVAAHKKTIFLPLKGIPISKNSQIGISAVEVNGKDTMIKLSISGRKLDKRDFFGKSDPYLEILRQQPDGTWFMVHRTNILKKTLNPDWTPFEVPQSRLIGPKEDLNTALLMRVLDWDANAEPDLIGEVQTSIQAMNSAPKYQFPIYHPRKLKKGKSSGTLVINEISFERMYSFLDYLANGTQMSLMVSIDFTGSNGDPKQPASLHYIHGGSEMNQYQKAIYATGSILEYYDADKKFPVFGFGAKFADGSVSHMFALNGQEDNPEVSGVDGILDAYRFALDEIILYGPTNFAPTINQIRKQVQYIENRTLPGSHYFLLLILTDGEITDMQDTVDAIVDASNLPLSIVIVGVGNADFEKMDTLDGDGKLLIASNGKLAARDIVQFVPFRNFAYHGGYDEYMLAKEVLAEIPDQVCQYMRKRKVAVHTTSQIAS